MSEEDGRGSNPAGIVVLGFSNRAEKTSAVPEVAKKVRFKHTPPLLGSGEALACALLCSAVMLAKLAVAGRVCLETVPTNLDAVQPSFFAVALNAA